MESFTSIVIVVIGIFVVVIIIMSRKWKDINLERLQMLPGEKILFEEGGLRAETRFRISEDTLLPGAKVLITNRRIIVAQKALFSKQHMIRYVILLKGKGMGQPPEGIGGGAFQTGYITYRTESSKISEAEVKNKPCLRIVPSDEDRGRLGIPDEVLIFTSRGSEIKQAIEN